MKPIYKFQTILTISLSLIGFKMEIHEMELELNKPSINCSGCRNEGQGGRIDPSRPDKCSRGARDRDYVGRAIDSNNEEIVSHHRRRTRHRDVDGCSCRRYPCQLPYITLPYQRPVGSVNGVKIAVPRREVDYTVGHRRRCRYVESGQEFPSLSQQP